MPTYYSTYGFPYFSFPAFSIPAFSTLSGFVPHFPVLHFHVSHFQRPLKYAYTKITNNIIIKLNRPSLVVFHHDFMSPIQYVLYLPEVVNQLISCVLFSGLPMLVKTANVPPLDKQLLLALYHVNEDEFGIIL